MPQNRPHSNWTSHRFSPFLSPSPSVCLSFCLSVSLQHTIKCTPDDRYLITYALLKLRLLRGKTIIFINDVNRCYKLKLFLEQFSIKSCVLNSELPIQSRQHIVEQFNKGVRSVISLLLAVYGTIFLLHF